MKKIQKIIILILLVLVNSCSQDEPTNPIDSKSNEANLLKLELEHGGTTHTTSINGTIVTLSNAFPYGTEEVSIKTLQLSDKATANKIIGDKLKVSDSPISIEVTAEDGTTKKYYELNFVVEERRNNFSTNNHFILFNDKPLDIKGVVYGPTYPSFYPWDIEGSRANLSEEHQNSILKDLSDIKAMGANTLRLWSPPNYIYQALKAVGGLYFFQTIWFDTEPHKRGLDFQSSTLKEEAKEEIREHISNIYSVYSDNSPPLIAYILGNELSKKDIEATNNTHPQITSYFGNYIQANNITATEAFLAEMADYLKTYEYENYGNASLVTYANMTPTSDILDAYFLDFISFNVYSWCLEYFTTSLGSSSGTYFQGFMEKLKNKHPNKPLLISETGLSIAPITKSDCSIGYGGITEAQQADGIIKNINDIKTANLPLAGVCIHEYTDSWWKCAENTGCGKVDKQESDQPEEWFGIVSFEASESWYNTKFRESYNKIKESWK